MLRGDGESIRYSQRPIKTVDDAILHLKERAKIQRGSVKHPNIDKTTFLIM